MKEYTFDLMLLNKHTREEIRACYDLDGKMLRKIAPPDDIFDNIITAREKIKEKDSRRDLVHDIMHRLADFICDRMEQNEGWEGYERVISALAVQGPNKPIRSRTETMKNYIEEKLKP